jgi:energy-coupling factor transporter ATP-binding protein EcfA2
MDAPYYLSHPVFDFEIALRGFSEAQLAVVRQNSCMRVGEAASQARTAGAIDVSLNPDPAFVRRLQTLPRFTNQLSQAADGSYLALSAGGQVHLSASGAACIQTPPGFTGFFYYLFETALYRLLAPEGIMSLHAALVVFNGRRVLFVGNRGAGKSTLATVVMRAGGQVISDDLVVVSLQQGTLRLAGMRPYMVLREPSTSLLQERHALQRFEVEGETKYLLAGDKGAVGQAISGLDRLVFVDGFSNQPVGDLAGLDAGRAYARLLAQTGALFLSDIYRAEQQALAPVVTALLQDVGYCVFRPGWQFIDSEACEGAVAALFDRL